MDHRLSRATTRTALMFSGLGLWALSAAQDSTKETARYAPPFDEKLTEAFRRMRRNDSFQFELPPPPATPETPGWLKSLGDAIRALFDILGPVFKVLFWIGVGILIAGAIYLIAQTIYNGLQARKNQIKAEPEQQPILYQPKQTQARILLDEIDDLAAQGRYDEAVHVLLHRSIQDIDTNRPNIIRRSLTSREIGSLSILTGAAQKAFSAIAQITEHSFFGGRQIGQAEYKQARKAYTDLVFTPNPQQSAA